MSVINDPDIIRYRCSVFEQAYRYGGAIYVLNPYKYPNVSDFIINYDDVMDYKYIIRKWINDGKGYGSQSYNVKSPIINCYDSIEEMVIDGWKMD